MDLSEALDVAGIGTFLQDYASGQHQWSSMCHRVFGTDPQRHEVNAELLGQLFHPDDRARIAHTVAEVHQGSASHYTLEFRIVTPDGSVRHIRTASLLERNDNGQVTCERGIVQDVSAQYRRIDEIIDRDKTQAKELLTAGTMHDLNNQIMIAMCSLLTREDDERVSSIADEVGDALNLACQLTHNLMRDLRGENEGEEGSVYVDRFLSEREQSFRRAAQPAQLFLSVEPSPLCIEASSVALAQILFNLIINAREAGARQIRVSAEADAKGHLELTVQDDGPGIAAELLPQIVQPWFSSKERGSGVGLSVVNTLCERLGAALTLRNRKPSGFEAAMTFPLKREEASPLSRSPRQLGGAGLRVVVADPSPIVGRLLTQGLRAFDFVAQVGDADDPADVYVVDADHEKIESFLCRPEPVLLLCASLAPHKNERTPRRTWLQKPCSPVSLAHALAELVFEAEST